MSTALAAGDAGSGKSSTLFNTSTDLPQFPGDQDVLAHVATTFRNAAEARLASRGLLAVAQGGMPPAAAQIINVDLTELPELPVDQRDHNRRKETRIRTITANKANDVKRKQLIYDAWTEIYGLVYKSVEVSAPVLAQELKDHCDLATTSGMPGGYFDGPRAWAILLVVVNHIPGVTNPADLFTKILSKQEFEKHRKVVLNLPGDTGVEHARREAVAGRSAPSQRDGTGAT